MSATSRILSVHRLCSVQSRPGVRLHCCRVECVRRLDPREAQKRGRDIR
jgi:hypothetical protein